MPGEERLTDRDAFEEVVDRHGAHVLRFIRTLVDDRDLAEDVLQETFVAAWRGAESFRGDGPVRAWLFSIARNAVRRQTRLRSGEPRHHATMDEVEELPALAIRAGWGAEGDRVARRLEARDLVERGLAALDPEDREILVLRDAEGFTGEEAAEILGLSLAAQKSRLHRARLRFMARIREVDRGT